MTTTTKQKTLLIGTKTVTSAAQAMTLIAYGESNDLPFRCLDFKTECSNFNDFIECIKIIDSYNDFDATEMMPFLRETLDLKKYYNEGNPNNGNSFFKFDIAREGSPAFYVSFVPQYDKNVIGMEQVYSLQIFKSRMKSLQTFIKADEMDISDEGFRVTARFWFD